MIFRESCIIRSVIILFLVIRIPVRVGFVLPFVSLLSALPTSVSALAPSSGPCCEILWMGIKRRDKPTMIRPA